MAKRARKYTPEAREIITRRCIVCEGAGAYNGEDCTYCDGAGTVVVSRSESWHRRKDYLGVGHPCAAKSGYEAWPRFSAEVPPEMAALLDATQKREARKHGVTNPERSNLVRAALRLWLESVNPEIEVLEGSVVDDTPDQRSLSA